MASDYEIISLLNENTKDWPTIKRNIIKELFSSYLERNPNWAKSLDIKDINNTFDMRPFEIFGEISRSLYVDVNDESDFHWKINSLTDKDRICHRYLNELENAAETYIFYRAEVSSKTLELWLLRAMAYEEISTLKEKNKRLLSESKSIGIELILKIIFFLIVLSCAIMIGTIYSAPVGFISFFSLVYLHDISHSHKESDGNKTRQTYDLMGRFYNKLTSHDYISPSEIERYANEARQSGALWPYGMYDIIRIAKDRSLMRWE